MPEKEENNIINFEDYVDQSQQSTSQLNKIPKKANNSNNIVDMTGKATQTLGKTVKTVGKGVQNAGKVAQLTGKGVSAASNAVGTSLSAVPVVGTALGGAVKGAGNIAGKSMQAVGKGAEVTGRGASKLGEKTNDAGKKIDEAGKKLKEKGNRLKRFGFGRSSSDSFNNEDSNSSNKTTDSLNKDSLSKDGLEKPKLSKEKDENKKESLKSKAKKMLHPVEVIKKKIKKVLVVTILPKLLAVLLVVVILCVLIEAVFEIFEKIDHVARGVANFHEKLDNLVVGLGFNNSEEAFYKEFERLNKQYDKELDFKLLMATVFYTDIKDGLDNDDESKYGMIEKVEDEGPFLAIVETVKGWVEESNKTVSKEGLAYTSNKIYRLRELAKHQFATGAFGVKKSKGNTETKSLLDYLGEDLLSPLGTNTVEFVKSIISLALSNRISEWFESVYQMVAYDENFFMTDNGAVIKYVTDNVYDYLKIIVSSVANADLEPCASHFLCVKYEKYSFDEDSYFEYLRKKYIPSMPEFKKYLKGLSGEVKEKEIENIIREIKDIAEEYDDIFGEKDADAEYFLESCNGTVKQSLVPELVKPVTPNDSIVNFTGTYAFGTMNKAIHQGIEINNDTTGNNEGDPVYSIYHHGKVEGTTKDDSFSCNGCQGGWVKITYEAMLPDGTYKFYALYGGLDPDSISVSNGDNVEQGQVIGKIGNAENSNVDIPSLFFAMYDLDSNKYMNPTNLYTGCSSSLSLVGDTNEEKIWFYLLQSGYNKYQAAAVLASVWHESGYQPNNLENTSNSKSGYSDEEFTAMVNSGEVDKEEFMKSSRFGVYDNLQYGYGLAQWTSAGWKGEMYDRTKGSGMLIDDFEGQLSYMVEVIDNDSTWAGHSNDRSIFQNVNSRDGVAAAANAYCLGYERPAHCDRGGKAVELYDTFADREMPQRTDTISGITAKEVASDGTIYTPNNSNVTSFDNFLFIGDSRTKGMKNLLANLGNNVTVMGTGGLAARDWLAYTNDFAPFTNYQSSAEGTYTFPSSVSGISFALGVNGPSDGTDVTSTGGKWPDNVSNTKEVLNRLLNHYPGVPIFVNSVIHQRVDFYSAGYGYGEIKASEWNKMIDRYNAKMKEFCDTNPNLIFIDVSGGFSDATNSTDYSDGLHFSASGSNKYINNLKAKIISNKSNASNQNSISAKNLNNFLFIGDSRYNGIRDGLKALGSGIEVAAVNSSTSAQWNSVISNGGGTVNKTAVTLPSPNKVSGISVMLGVNGMNPNDLKNVLTKLHQRYPNVRIYVNSVYYLASNYTYSDVKTFNKNIDNFNKEIKNYCDSNSSYLTYIDITSGLYSNGYLDSSLSNDPEGIHIYSDKGKQTLINNISNGIKNNLK